MEEEEEEDQREMARTKETKRMEPSAETDKSHLGKRDTRNALTDRRIDDLVTDEEEEEEEGGVILDNARHADS